MGKPRRRHSARYVKEGACGDKVMYMDDPVDKPDAMEGREKAYQAAKIMTRKYRRFMRHYRCPFCERWVGKTVYHIGGGRKVK